MDINEMLRRLLGTEIVGNAYDDHDLLQWADQIILSDAATMDQKIQALRRLDEVIGEEQEEVTELDVIEYIVEARKQ
jgi:hypothetical protein